MSKYNKSYFKYLQKRHRLSIHYRHYVLYPYYNNLLKGKGLEIGCGLGDYLEYTNNFFGIDINPDAVQFCRNKNLSSVEGDAYDIPYPNKSFDCILLDNVFEHLDDPSKCLNEVRRVLRPNGLMLIAVPNKFGWKKDPTHVTYWDDMNLPNIVTEHCFEILIQKNHPFPKLLGNLFWPYNIYYILCEKK